MQVNQQYNVAAAGSAPIRLSKYQRRKMFAQFMAAMTPGAGDTIVDVGVTGDQDYDHSNYFVAWYPHKEAITAAGLDDASFLERQYPGVTFVRADGRALPFADGAFDYAHSSAVLEHVGSRANQIAFVHELWRVARKGVFLTTPNRWFPVEFHTVLPLLHWLPAPLFRRILKKLGRDFFASEANLNLLSKGDINAICRAAGIKGFEIGTTALVGWPTNLLLIARKV